MNDEEIDAMLTKSAASGGATDEPHPPMDELLALARDRLAADARTKLEAHLAKCVTCRDLVADLSEPLSDQMIAKASSAISATPKKRWVGGAIVALAAIAATVLFIVNPPRSELVPYEMAGPFGASQSSRGDAPTVGGTFHTDNRVEFILAPTTAVQARSTSLALYVETPSGAIRKTAFREGELHQTAEGAYRIRIAAGELFTEQSGDYLLHVFVGPPRDWPDEMPSTDSTSDTQYFGATTSYEVHQEQ